MSVDQAKADVANDHDEPGIDSLHMRKVLGLHPTGVAVVSSKSASGETLALVVGSFTSVSLSPPLVGFFPAKDSSTWPEIAETGRFVVSTLADDQLDECRALSGKIKALEHVEWRDTASGLPMVAKAVASVECRIESVVEAGDHWFVMGRIQEITAHRDVAPLLFWNGVLGGRPAS